MIKQEKYRFTVGELDPKLYTRSDTEFYSSGADTMKNVLCLPEGGFIARPGTKFINKLPQELNRIESVDMTITMPNGGNTALINNGLSPTLVQTTVNIGNTNPYVIAQYDLGVSKEIEFVDIVDCRLSSAGVTDNFAVQWSNDAVSWNATQNGLFSISEIQKTKRFRIGTGNGAPTLARYVRFVKLTTTDLGARTVILNNMNVYEPTGNLAIAKRIDFVFNADQTYIIFLTDKNIAIYRNGVNVAHVRAVSYSNNNIQNVYPTQTADKALLFQGNIRPHELTRISDTDWTFNQVTFKNIPFYDFDPVVNSATGTTLTPSETSGKITLTTGAAFWTTGAASPNIGQYVDGNGGRARIVSVQSTTVADAIVEIPFYNTDAIPDQSWDYESGYEAQWSSTRGWPVSGIFFQQRLTLGGSRSRPRTLYQSRIGEFFDFDIGSLRDDDATVYDIDGDEPIVSLVGNRNLQVFTTGNELANIQSRLVPSTINNFNLLPQTNVGSKQGIKPLVVDGNTLFLQRGGHSIGQYVFTEAEQSFDTTNLSFLSSHLIKDPVDFTVRKSTNAEEASYLMIVNNDGTLTFGCILGEQGVKGFTQATTDGLYKNVAVDGDTMYCVVERDNNGVQDLFLEQFDFDVNTDSAVVQDTPATDTFTGFTHLIGKTIKVIGDGNILDDVVVATDSITTERVIDNRFEGGLDYDVFYKSLPYKNPEALGPGLHYNYRLSKVYVYAYNCASIAVNGQRISLQDLLDFNPLDASNPIRTGIFEVGGIQGWENNGIVEITRPEPLPFGVLGYSTFVEVGTQA